MPAGAIVGVIGGNGAGKSTLFKIITGQESPDSGTVEVGDTVQLAYVDQSRDTLDGSKTVWAEYLMSKILSMWVTTQSQVAPI